MEPAEFMKLTELLKQLGQDIVVNPEEAKAYLPEIESIAEFYLPKVQKGFYDGCFERLRRLGTPRIGGMFR